MTSRLFLTNSKDEFDPRLRQPVSFAALHAGISQLMLPITSVCVNVKLFFKLLHTERFPFNLVGE